MIVVDASVAFKWLKSKDESHRNEAALILQRHLEGTVRITVPDLFFTEIANALVTKTSTNRKTIRSDIIALYAFDLEIYRTSLDDIMESALLAHRKKTSMYDMLYAVTADKLKATLVTADQKFIAKTKFNYIKHLRDYRV